MLKNLRKLNSQDCHFKQLRADKETINFKDPY